MNSGGDLSHRATENSLLSTRRTCLLTIIHHIVSQWREVRKQLVHIVISLNHLSHSFLLLPGKFYCGFRISRTGPNHLLIYVCEFFSYGRKQCFIQKGQDFCSKRGTLLKTLLKGSLSASECKSVCRATYSFLPR